MDHDPIARFKKLLAKAEQLGIRPHNAAAFATTGLGLQPLTCHERDLPAVMSFVHLLMN
ncbi:MAG: hypothetical protein WD688_22070 [Candidatus Binatia bacterium]